jgi:hypothetical protein
MAEPGVRQDFIDKQKNAKENKVLSDMISSERKRNQAEEKQGIKDHRFGGDDLDDLDTKNQDKAKKEKFTYVWTGLRQRTYHTSQGDVPVNEQTRYDEKGDPLKFTIARVNGEDTAVRLSSRDVVAYTKGPDGLTPMKATDMSLINEMEAQERKFEAEERKNHPSPRRPRPGM